MSEEAFIALGSNLNNPILQVKNAINEIAKLEKTKLLKCSSLFKTKPLGGLNQPDYINAVAKVSTTLSPVELLDALLAIEIKQGRIREDNNRWCSRTLDCDILLYGQKQIQSTRLVVPHPEMEKRIFVIKPLSEIEPDLIIFGKSIKAILTTFADEEDLREILDEEINA